MQITWDDTEVTSPGTWNWPNLIDLCGHVEIVADSDDRRQLESLEEV
jgi:hypothetical protein